RATCLSRGPQAGPLVVGEPWTRLDAGPSERAPLSGRTYAMWVLYCSLNSAHPFVSYADTRPDGTHTAWSTPQELSSISGHPYDQYLLPHVDPDGVVYSTSTLNYPKQCYSTADMTLVFSTDGGATWQCPLPVLKNIEVPTYQNTTFREGIVNSFAVGRTKMNGYYPLYVTYEDSSTGMSRIYLIASYDRCQSWTAPIQVDDGD